MVRNSGAQARGRSGAQARVKSGVQASGRPCIRMHSVRHLSSCIRAFASPRVCLVVTPAFVFVTVIGGDFTRSWLSLPLSQSTKKSKAERGKKKTSFEFELYREEAVRRAVALSELNTAKWHLFKRQLRGSNSGLEISSLPTRHCQASK